MIARRASALARLAVAVRRARADIQYAAGMAWMHLSEWIRPLDPLGDRFRWRWQDRTPCGRTVVAAMPPPDRAVLERALADHLDRRDDTGRGGAT